MVGQGRGERAFYSDEGEYQCMGFISRYSRYGRYICDEWTLYHDRDVSAAAASYNQEVTGSKTRQIWHGTVEDMAL